MDAASPSVPNLVCPKPRKARMNEAMRRVRISRRKLEREPNCLKDVFDAFDTNKASGGGGGGRGGGERRRDDRRTHA